MILSKPTPILKDMPYHIKKMIVESIPSYLDRLPLRKTSREFIRIVDTAKVEMTFEICLKAVRTHWETPNSLWKELASDKEVIDHLKCFVSKPNVRFSVMSMFSDRAFSVELVEMLTATVHRPLRVKSFTMVGDVQARILEFMEPGTLGRVFLIKLDQVEAESIFRMEQWRQAQHVYLINISAACEVWWDFPCFDIYFNQSINLTDLPRILEHLLNSDTFLYGAICKDWTIDTIVEALGDEGWQWKQDEERFAEKEFAVPRHGSRIIVKVYKNKVFFVKELN